MVYCDRKSESLEVRGCLSGSTVMILGEADLYLDPADDCENIWTKGRESSH